MLDAARHAVLSKSTKVVSFDVFDTLLIRPTIAPTDLFHLVERRICDELGLRALAFVSTRRWAEAEARKEMKTLNPGYEDITLDEIYEVFRRKLRVSEEDIRTFKRIELEVERDHLSTRRKVKDLYDLAKARGKRVIAVSDVYLPGWFVADTLAACGFELDQVYVSSDLRKSKGRGGMYPLVLADLGIKPEEMVHIGDNERADYKKALHFGIRAFHIPKVVEDFADKRVDFSPWANRVLDQTEPGYRIMLGHIANSVFDTVPRDGWNTASLFNGTPYLLGHYGLGPLLYTMTYWLMRRAIRDGAEATVFVARDGALMMQIYEMLRQIEPKAPPAKYLRISRSVCFPFDIETDADFLMNNQRLHIDRNMAAGDILRDRMSLEITEDLAAHLEQAGYALDRPVGNFETFFQCCLDFGPDIRAGLTEQREMATEYYRDFFDGLGKVALFDVGYSGRAQRVLSTIVDTEIRGYYFYSFDKILELDRFDLPYENYVSVPTNRYVRDIEMSTGLIEALVSEYDVGSTIGFTREAGRVVPVLEQVSPSVATTRVLNAVQSGALDFARGFAARFARDLHHIQISAPTSLHILKTFMTRPGAADAAMFKNMDFSNGITGQSFHLVGNSLAASHWKEGFLAMQGKPPAPAKPRPIPEYGFGFSGWRRALMPVVRRFVRRLGNAQDLRAFNQNPKLFFEGLSSQRYQRIGRVLFP